MPGALPALLSKKPAANKLGQSISLTPKGSSLSLNLPTPPILNAPKGATHYRIILAGATLSPYTFDEIAGYQPQNRRQNGNFTQTGTGWLPLNPGSNYPKNPFFTHTPDTNFPAKFTPSGPGLPTLQISFRKDAGLRPETSAIAALGIEFAQKVNGAVFPFTQHASMQFIHVWNPGKTIPQQTGTGQQSASAPDLQPELPYTSPIVQPYISHRCIVVDPSSTHSRLMVKTGISPPPAIPPPD